MKNIEIRTVASAIEREPLIRPFGFKGSFTTEAWQIACKVESASGITKVGLGNQGVLWSDAAVFTSHTEKEGNELMYSLTKHALQLVKGRSFNNPIALFEDIYEEVYQYGVKITANPELRETFALNALVGVDNALWLLYAAENGISNFDDLIPGEYKTALSRHNKAVASIPLMAYAVPVTEIMETVDSGYFFLKIKIGQSGSQEEMLAKDIERLSMIHEAIGHYQTPHTSSGKLPYYLDANGRYESMESLMTLIDHADKIGALEQIAIIEEPFPEELDIEVHNIPVRLAADESAHTDNDANARIDMGYKAIALKPIAKTLSMTLKMAKAARERGIPCFCADLTVNPILVDWNKNIAARLDPFPGLDMGLLETNGHQNYKNWATMESCHPFANAEWRKVKGGIFFLDDDFYEKSGGIFEDSEHYVKLFG